MDMFYRMGKQNGYRTDGAGGQLAYSGVSITLSLSGTEALRNIFRKKGLMSFGRLEGDDGSDLHRFVGLCGDRGRAVVGLYLDESDNIVFVQEDMIHD